VDDQHPPPADDAVEAAPDPAAAKSAPTHALALRSPAALNRKPSFYPEGHAQSFALASVLLAGPALALGLGIAGSIVAGPAGAALFGLVGWPAGQVGASWYFQNRGKRTLSQALAMRERDRPASNAALEAVVANRRWLPEVRVEAAGVLAMDALDRGDVARAVSLLDFDEGDRDLIRRRRNWDTGCRGEVLRSILAWLSPGSFTEIGVATASDFPPPRDHPEGAALLSALALLEAVGQSTEDGEDGRIAAAWQDVRGSELSIYAPILDLIVTAVAAQRLPRLQDELFERLRNDPEGRLRALLRRLFPRMQLLGEAGYRGVSEEPTESPDEPVPDVDAPEQITALARMPDAALAPVSRAPVAGIFAAIYGTLFGLGSLVGLMAGGGLGAVLGGFVAMIMGIYAAPIPILMGSRTIETRERMRRVAPLLGLEPKLPAPWLTEIASGPPGRLEQSSGYRRLPDIPRSQMILHVAVARGEAALFRLELDEAWSQVSWWFAGARGRIPGDDPMFAAASSLLRIATLTGHLAEAERLSGLLEPVDRPWDDLSRRTAYGNASRALGMARALLAARQGYWEHAASHLTWAARHRTVYIAPHDHALYAAVAERCAARGLELRTHGLVPQPQWTPWVDAVLPER